MGTRPQHAPAYRRLREMLRAMREEAGLTQRALALRLRKPHTTIHKAETGDRRIDPVEFIAWCRGCGIDPREAIERVERG